jgi:hypothetical protein
MKMFVVEANEDCVLSELEIESFNATFKELKIRYDPLPLQEARKAFIHVVVKDEWKCILARRREADIAAKKAGCEEGDRRSEQHEEARRQEALSELKPTATSCITHTLHGTMVHAPTFHPDPQGKKKVYRNI